MTGLSDQISCLIFLCQSIKIFTCKWKLISNKLEEILSILSSLPPENQHPILSNILQSIQDTIHSSNNLARKCIESSYTGKLLMQSDLDIIFSKFDNNLKSLSEFVNSDGFLSNGNYAIVVSRPGISASTDDIKFYVNDLLSRFKIGKIEMKKQALISFNDVIQEDERYVKIGMEIDGFSNVLIRFLNSKDFGVQEEALKSVSVICAFDSYKTLLVSLGVVPPLIRVLETGTPFGKQLSARSLIKLTANSDNAWSVSANAGVSALLNICGTASDDDTLTATGELVGLACNVLRNLIGVDEIKRFVIEQGSIPLCLKLVRSKNECSHLNAIDFIQVMASGNDFVKGLIVNEGGIRVLVRLLDPKCLYSSKAREKSIRALMILCSDSIGYINTLKHYGFMDYILDFLQNGEVSIQESALRAAYWLSATSDEFKKAMGDSGFMPELVKYLDAKSFEAREIAAETLLRLVVMPRNQKRFVHNDENVNLVLQQIEANSGNRKVLLSIIMSLSVCNEGRNKILSSRYLKNIEKLAEDEVLDAKKIVRNLTSSRIRSLIRGIWHS